MRQERVREKQLHVSWNTYLPLIHYLRRGGASWAAGRPGSGTRCWICGRPRTCFRLLVTCYSLRKNKCSAHTLHDRRLWTHPGPLPEAEGFPGASDDHRGRGSGPSTDPCERKNRALAWLFRRNEAIVDRPGFTSTYRVTLKTSPPIPMKANHNLCTDLKN